MKQNKKFYDEFFTSHDLNVHNDPNRFKFVSALLRGRVLDCACGTGSLSEYCCDSYVGVDFSTVAIAKAKSSRPKTAHFEVLDCEKQDFSSLGKFDSVYFGEVLEHVEDDSFMFESAIKCLNPKGRIVCSVPNSDRVPDESHCRIFTVPQIRREYSKYGLVRFYNWPGAFHRIIFSIDLDTKKENEISLVMIVKDEQKGLERAILSALPLVDNIVISVDSESTDATEHIARRYADTLKTHIWENHFSKARNFAQEGVKTKWILFLDGHEYIETFGEIKNHLAKDVDGVFVTVRMESGLTFLHPRLYSSKIQFTGAVHNMNACETKAFCPTLIIVHDRLNGQDQDAIERRDKQRDEMMPKELLARIKENKADSRARFHLGNYYMYKKEFKLALDTYKKYRKYSKSPDELYLVELNIGLIHTSFNNDIRARWAFYRADKVIPGRWETARAIGGLYYKNAYYNKALEFLVTALQPNTRKYIYEPMKHYRLSIWDMIGDCFAQLGSFTKARVAFERALDLSENDFQKSFFSKKIEVVKLAE